ncbi:unnamed protein product [Hydatigera taeniaeformis]|uniref:MSP domain-containing protein n=1 Tax=Hydatigena taeniaeformis TaxID=6205 RepID=A0A0R3WNM4_HYDTA|nr:unnamed protein product [Hydatigera taeniaeformis]
MEIPKDEDASEVTRGTTLEIFKHLSMTPASKQFRLCRKSDFTLTARYSNPDTLHIKNPLIGVFRITNIVPTPPDVSCLVKIKARVNSNGIFTISSADIMEKVEKEVEVPIEDSKPDTSSVANASGTEMETETHSSEQPPAVGAASGVAEAAVANQSPPKPKTRLEKKIVLRPRGVPVDATTSQLTPDQLLEFTDFQARLNQSDMIERERQDLKNALEAYVYEMRSKLETCLQHYTTETERDSFNKALTDTEDWIYDEGEDAKKSTISKRLKALQQTGDRYCLRFAEADSRRPAIEALANSCEKVKQVVEDYAAGDPQYDHLSKEDMAKVENTLKTMQQRLNAFVEAAKQLHPTSDPTVFVSELYNAQKELESICNPIITRPKPAPPPPKPADNGGSKTVGRATEDGEGNVASPKSGKTPSVPNGGEVPDSTSATTLAGGEDMDVD